MSACRPLWHVHPMLCGPWLGVPIYLAYSALTAHKAPGSRCSTQRLVHAPYDCSRVADAVDSTHPHPSQLPSTTLSPSSTVQPVSQAASASLHAGSSGEEGSAEGADSYTAQLLLNPSQLPSIAVIQPTSPAATRTSTAAAAATTTTRTRSHTEAGLESDEEDADQAIQSLYTSSSASRQLNLSSAAAPSASSHRRVKRRRRHSDTRRTTPSSSNSGTSSPSSSFTPSIMQPGAFQNGASNGLSATSAPANGHHDQHPQDGSFNSAPSTSKLSSPTIYPGSQISREELVRLTLQCLQDAGYSQSASALSKESGFVLESPTVTAFRNGVLEGKWETVVRLLQDEHIITGIDVSTVRFKIAEQKFLEYLEARDTKRALSVLRNELAPLNHNPDRLHQLSSFMMCGTPEELRERSGWLGSGEASRQQLLASLQDLIPASIMIPQRRLETLLEQAKSYQRTQCRYHAADADISLYTDHVCDRTVFPTVTTHVLGGHTDEVWRVEFSHNGAYLATASCDGTVQIWTVKDSFALLHTLHAAEHTEDITSIAWSPDDTMLLLGVECAIKLYDVQTGLCTLNVTKHEYCAIGGVAWLPNGSGFFSGGLDMRVLCWDLDGNVSYTFSTGPYRIVDIAISPDSSRLVCLGEVSHVRRNPASNGAAQTDATKGSFDITDRKIIIFNLQQRARETMISHNSALTSVVFAQNDSRHAIVNSAPNEVIMYDVVEGRAVKTYYGQTQSGHMIRSCMGGSANGFIISGSEDANIYVWHKSNDRPLEVLTGHGRGCVNDVSWNPASSAMFASAGDDKTVRIWQAQSALPSS